MLGAKDDLMTKGEEVTLTRQELRDLMSEVVDETLTKLGIEAQDHREMQADMLFLRKLRNAHESIQGKAVLTLVGVAVTALAALLIGGILNWLRTSL